MPTRWPPLLALLIAACGVPQEQYAAKVREADSLREVLDDLEHGASRTLAKAKAEWNSGNRPAARAAAVDLLTRHPSAPEATDAQAVLAMADTADSADARQVRAEAAARESERAAALSGLRKKRDDMEGYTTYRPRGAPEFVNSRSWVVPYIYDGDTGPPRLKFVIYYVADEWLIVERYLFKVDGVAYEFTPDDYGPGRVERDNGSGGIWEWWGTDATDGQARRFLEALANSKEASMRYDGKQYYKDRTLTAAEREGARQVIRGFEALRTR